MDFSNPSGASHILSSYLHATLLYPQASVALDRISTYLDEDEVSKQVSTLKRSRAPSTAEGLEADRLGLENASFIWNEVPRSPQKGDKQEIGKGRQQIEVSTDPVETMSDAAIEGQSDNGEEVERAEKRRFELRDIDVIFPEGKLSVITGPTASGKTALLVCRSLSLPFKTFS